MQVKSLSSCIRYCVLALLLCALPQVAFALDEEPSAPQNNKVPTAVEDVLDMLLKNITGSTVPPTASLAPLLDYVTDPTVDAGSVSPRKRDQGAGCFVRTTLNVPFSKMLRYCYDPQIPGEALYPNVIRRHSWLPQSPFVQQKVQLWEKAGKLADGQEPLAVRGQEQEEITPDSFSGCFYTYVLDRLILLVRYKGKDMLISAARQQKPSTVGKIGAIVGDDNQWSYVYSQKVGSDLALAKWAETYMYDAANVTVLYQSSPSTTGMAFFKYVKAGWAGMNMVKPKHIASGIQRFLTGFKQVIQSSALPAPEAIVAKRKELNAMSDAQLQEALTPYAQALSTRADKKPLSSSVFQPLVKDGNYVTTLTKEERISELMKQYMREKLGKPLLKAGS